ncbi:MAG: cation-transporting P-type ATPase, partial [Clostridia bacterium]
MDWFKQELPQVSEALDTNIQSGLSAQEAAARLERNGKNELKQGKRKSIWRMYLEQFKDVMVIVLIVAALVSGILLGEWVDAAIILFVVLLNALLGVIQENRAEKSLEALKKMSSPHAKVRRGGQMLTVPAAELVVGDVVILEAGDYVSADMRLTVCANLKVNESAL